MEEGRGGNRDSYIVSTYIVQGVVPILCYIHPQCFWSPIVSTSKEGCIASRL